MYLTVSMRLTILAVNSIGSTKLNALPTDSCRISGLRLTMCCCPTPRTLIRTAVFEPLQGRYGFQRTHNGFQDRCIMYYSFIYTLEENIRQNSL